MSRVFTLHRATIRCCANITWRLKIGIAHHAPRRFGSCFIVQKDNKNRYIAYMTAKCATLMCKCILNEARLSLFPFMLSSSNQATCNKYEFYLLYVHVVSSVLHSCKNYESMKIHVNLSNTKQYETKPIFYT